MLPAKIDLNERLCAKLRELRINNPVEEEVLTAENLSRLIGNNRAWMSQIESGRLKKIKREDVIAIYKLLFNISSDSEAEDKAEEDLYEYIPTIGKKKVLSWKDFPSDLKITGIKKPKYSLPKDIVANHKQVDKIEYDNEDITNLVFSKSTAPVTYEQMTAYVEFSHRAGNAIAARVNLLRIISKLDEYNREDIQNNIPKYQKDILENVVYWYNQCWSNINSVFPKEISELPVLFELIDKCLLIDTIAAKEFYLIDLPYDFSWLRDKLR